MRDISGFLDGYIIEQAINRALQLDPEVAIKLAELENKTITIELNIRPRPWMMRISQGRVYFEELQERADVRLSGTLGGFLQLFRDNRHSHGINDKLYIEGDLHAAQQFQRVMGEIKPDFAGALRHRFGDKLGGVLAEGFLQLQQGGEKAKEHLNEQLRGFFTGEKGQCLNRAQYNQFARRLDEVRLGLDRLQARIAKLEN